MTDIAKSPLSGRILTDVGVAAFASALVSPLVSLIDGSIVSRSATNQPILSCLRDTLWRMGTSPLSFVRSKPFQLVFNVYFLTYTTANIADTIYASRNSLPAWQQSATTEKFIATTFASTASCTYKDGQLARIFGRGARKLRVPAASYSLFILRDAVTIYASFTLPLITGKWLTRAASSEHASVYFGALKSEAKSLKTAQMLLPAAAQFVSTPIHLLGLDLHNDRRRQPLGRRLRAVTSNLGVAIPLRMLRIVPAFGIGNVVNTSLRDSTLGRNE